ncbi:MAG: RHS repeat-associated protein [Granulosicoccus sp.]|jgi:RHS repeat-associated protein
MCCLCWFTAFADADTSVVYYHNDALGSPVAATNENGDVIWKEDYAPYGAKLSDDMEAVIEKVGYTGHRYDNETGLVYAGARMYDPSLGRFMGIDPVGAMAAVNNPVMFNRYAYGNNNPYKYVDPDGRAPHRFSDGNYSDNDGQENQGWSSQVNKAYAQMGKGIAEGWQYNPAVLIGTGGLGISGVKELGKGLISRFVAKGTFQVGKSLGAAATRISVRGGSHLAEGSKVMNIRKIADGRGIREVGRLVEQYGGKAKSWLKRSGDANVVTTSGSVRRAEVHWYEAHGVGKVEFKVKTWLD